MKLTASLLILFLSSCSSIFWRDAKLFPSISFSESGNSFAYLRVHYQEKDSWNPLNGTTLKKDFTTQVILTKILPDLSVKKSAELKRFEFWILPESLYYNEATGLLTFINGLSQDEYGTLNRTVSAYNSKSKTDTNILKDKPEIKSPLSISLSGDAKLLAIISGEPNENGFMHNFKLHIIEISSNSIQGNFPLPDWQDAPGEFELAWSKSEPVLFVHLKNKLLQVKGNSISESKFSGPSFADNSKYAYYKAYKWESADVEVDGVKLIK